MKRIAILPVLIFSCLTAASKIKDSTLHYVLPDSVKAVQFMTEIKVGDFGQKKHYRGGISTSAVSLYIDNYYKEPAVRFAVLIPGNRKVRGINVYNDLKYGHFNYRYKWKVNTSYRLLISMATDSAGNSSLYSGYIFLPEENKWKLIGTYKVAGYSPGIRNASSFFVAGKKYNTDVMVSQAWVQRSNGSWKNLGKENMAAPAINMYSHTDSVQQRQIEIKQIEDSIAGGKTDAVKSSNGVYYSMMKEGTGRQVSVNDTVVAHYKGYLFSDGTVFDQTKDKPATFLLTRLIMGWQIGVPLCKVGGKIKLLIPSNLAYSIRTRSGKIPPNSILVFEIEVVDAKPSY